MFKPHSINLLKSTTSVFNKVGLGGVDVLGKIADIIAPGVQKFSTSDPEIRQFIVFYAPDGAEVCFSTASLKLCTVDIEKEFGKLWLSYNWRENYSEFRIRDLTGTVYEIYFVAENKFEVSSEGQFTETTPQGKKSHHLNLCFDGFCLRLGK